VTYSLKIKSSAAKKIQCLPHSDRVRVVEAIDNLKANPHSGTLLKGQLTGLRRIRVGNYRVIYEVQHAVLVILVLRVGHRKEIYR
jgi:mRNA interferase RelE/StbE